jgi:hypothetical protein
MRHQLGNVSACAEHARRCRLHDNDPNSSVDQCGTEKYRKLIPHFLVECVSLIRPVDQDATDGAVTFQPQAHAWFLETKHSAIRALILIRTSLYFETRPKKFCRSHDW